LYVSISGDCRSKELDPEPSLAAKDVRIRLEEPAFTMENKKENLL